MLDSLPHYAQTIGRSLGAMLFFGIVTFALASSSALGQRQQTGTNTVDLKAHAREERFVRDLQAVAHRWRVSFVAEGTPIPNNSAPAMSISTSNLDVAVEQIAAEYDFESHRKGNVFALTKRYSDPADFPDITPEEYRIALDAALRDLAVFNPKLGHEGKTGTPIAAIGKLLSPTQLDGLANNGVPVRSLNPDQRAAVWRIAMHYYVESDTDELATIAVRLGSVITQDSVFRFRRLAGVNAFGYELRNDTSAKESGETAFFPLSHANVLFIGNKGVAPNGEVGRITARDKNGFIVHTIDPTDPAAEGKNPVIIPEVTNTATTVKRVIDALTVRSRGANQYKVDPVLEAKAVTVIGGEYARPFEIFEAISKVYGLQLKQEQDRSILLAFKPERATEDIAQLPRVLKSAIPDPLLRWFRARIQKSNRPAFAARPMLRTDIANPSNEARQLATRLFRAQIEPRIVRDKDKGIRFSNIADRERKLFAFAAAVGALGQVTWMTERAIPPYVQDFESIVLTGGVTFAIDGKPRLALFLSYGDRQTGSFHQGVGFMNARIPESPE